MSNQLIEYAKLHLLSLNQDLEALLTKMDSIQDLNSDEYKMLEIEEVSLNGQFIGVVHMLDYILELTNAGAMV